LQNIEQQPAGFQVTADPCLTMTVLRSQPGGGGSSARTTIGQAGSVLVAGDDPDEFTVLVHQSFANYLADWLDDAAQEFRGGMRPTAQQLFRK
jgi:hypothetical protein